MDKFDFWGIFFKNLINPKPFPKPACDCPCKPKPDAQPEVHSVQKPAGPSAGLADFFIGYAYAQEILSPVVAVRPPPVEGPQDSFVERVRSRLYWLTESESLEGRIIDRSRFNGMRFSYLSLYFSVVFIFPIIAITVAAQMFAGEISGGTLRTSLLRPIRRSQLLAAKIAVLAGYLCALILLFSIVTIVVGIGFSGYGNLVLDSDILGIKGAGKFILADGAVMLFLLSAPVVVVSLMPLAFFAVLLSYLKSEPSDVIGVSSVVYLILFTLGGLPLFDEIRFLFFTTYMDAWLLLFDIPLNAGGFAFKLTVIGLLALALLTAVNAIFLKRDIYE